MKLIQLFENDDRRAGYRKGTPLSNEIRDRFVIIYRAQPVTYAEFTDGSYATRSLKFAKEHAISSANYEEEPFHVVKVMVDTKYVFNADNPGEYIYGGPTVKGKSVFTAQPGDDFDMLETVEFHNTKLGDKDIIRFHDEVGGHGFFTLEDGIPSIIDLQSVPRDKKYAEDADTYKKRGFLTSVIEALKAHGYDTFKVKMQSGDTKAALRRLTDKGVITPDVNSKGGLSVDEYYTIYNIK